MGIPGLFMHYYKKYNKMNELTICHRELSNMNISDLFFDYNSCVHPCAHQVLSANYDKYILIDDIQTRLELIEKEIIEQCIRYTKSIIYLIKPDNVYIMIDGVAPMAKIKQQKDRRYKSYFIKKYEALFKDKNSLWDSNSITPGTLFMDKLSKSLKDFQSKSEYNIYISDSNDPGEGEHKMMNIINNNLSINQGHIAIYGLDCDLVMLSLMSKQSDSIILIRDNSNITKDDINEFTYVNIKVLKDSICNDIKDDEILRINDNQIINDYIFLCFLLGNDFLNNLPSLSIKDNGANLINKFYKTVIQRYEKGTLIDNNNINMNMLKDIFYHMSKSEKYYFSNIYKIVEYKDVYNIEDLEKVNMIIHKENLIDMKSEGYKERYYLYYGINDTREICKNYLEGLQWTLGYYNSHMHNNWDWYYKFDCSPFASDIYNYISNLNPQIDITQFDSNEPITQFQQLLIVLPNESFKNICKNKNIKDKIDRYNNNQMFNKIYPEIIHLDMINKEYLWQSKIFFECGLFETLELFSEK